MALIQTKALILRHTTEREHDRVLTILTPDHGQLRVRARGTKKSTSKLAGSLEPVMEVEMNIAEGRIIGQVIGSVIIERFPGLHEDLVASVSSQWLLELVAVVTKPEQVTAEVYNLVRSQLEEMEKELTLVLAKRWLRLLRRASQILLLEGFWPSMSTCGRCHQPLDGDISYEPSHGFVHRREASPAALPVDASLIAFLTTETWPSKDRPALLQLHKVVEAIIHHTIDQPLRSERVLRSVMRLELPARSSTR